jgi:hypothetical protein
MKNGEENMDWMEMQIQYEKDHYSEYDEWSDKQINCELEDNICDEKGIDAYDGNESLEDIINRNIKTQFPLDKKYIKNNRNIEIWITRKDIQKDYYRVLPCNLYQALYKADLTKNELKILLYLVDITVGYFRNITDDSNPDRSHGLSLYKISKETGLISKNVKASMVSLERKNIIWKYEAKRAVNSSRIYRYYLNEYFEFWNITNATFQNFIKNEIEYQPDRLKKRQREIAKKKKQGKN